MGNLRSRLSITAFKRSLSLRTRRLVEEELHKVIAYPRGRSVKSTIIRHLRGHADHMHIGSTRFHWSCDELIARHGKKIVRGTDLHTDSFGRLSLEVGKTTSYRRETSSMEWTEIDTRIESGSSYHYRLATTVLSSSRAQAKFSWRNREKRLYSAFGVPDLRRPPHGSTFHSRLFISLSA